MKINSDYDDLLRLFDGFGIRYLIVGAYAAMKYTEPVWTRGMDVWVEPVEENAARVLSALQRFGAPLAGLTVADLTDPQTVFQIGVAGNRIDILTAIPGLSFDQAWARREQFSMNDAGHPVLSAQDAIAAAEASNRPKDRDRIKALKKSLELRRRLGLPSRKTE